MLNKLSVGTLALASLLLAACNDSDEPEQVKFSLGVSDAPVEEAEVVSIEIDSITLKNTNSNEEILIDSFTNEAGDTVEIIRVDLLEFTGMAQMKIVDEAQGITLNDGVYTMELKVIDAGSFVRLENDAETYAIKVPSSRLKLGEFTVSSDAVQIDDKPAYTIEFDLMKSLVQRGNDPAKNGFIIKPHGVRIVSLSGAITGTVSSNNTNLGACMVYLYDGTHTLDTKLADIFDSSDDTFIGDEPTAIAPLATTTVSVDGSDSVEATYTIGFVPAGAYTIALRCDSVTDDNVQYDGLTIPSFVGESQAGNLQTVNVSANIISTVDF